MTRKIILLLSLTVIIGMMGACSNSKKESTASLTEKKVKLEQLKKDKAGLDADIQKLQAEIAKLDTAGGAGTNARLVGVQPVAVQDFHHYIDLQGKVDAQNTSYISPRMGPAQVKAVYVHPGQFVKKGQLLLKLDDAIIRQQVVASRQQLEGIRTQLTLARSLYDRQQNLWKQGIGTEVQLLTARTNVQGLENQLRASGEQVKVAQEQLNTSNVYSDVSGVADIVNIRVGEIFMGMGANGQPQIKIVNTSNLKVVANVPENYVSRITKGTPVRITVPNAGRTINSTISLLSQSIDPTQRGFIAEAKINSDAALKPNQSVVMQIEDYSAKGAMVIPINVVQSDEKNKYVYVMEKTSNGKMVAKKKIINLGEVYDNLVEVKTGLAANDMLITEGYQSIYEGQVVTTQAQ
ncbi:MAG: efflux RND transporter periplasmic adaptor subunit [Ferruginibacter sp.]